MKKSLLALTLITTISTFSQVQITEPTETGAFVYVDKNEGSGVALEKMTGTQLHGGNSLGETYKKLKFKNESSTVKIKKKDILQFVFRFDKSLGGNIIKTAKLVYLIPEKKKRWVKKENFKDTKKNTSPRLHNIKLEPYKENSIIVTVKDLAVGEYAFVTGQHKVTHARLSNSDMTKKFFWGFSIVE